MGDHRRGRPQERRRPGRAPHRERGSKCATCFSRPRPGSNSSRRRGPSATWRSTWCGGWRWPIPAIGFSVHRRRRTQPVASAPGERAARPARPPARPRLCRECDGDRGRARRVSPLRPRRSADPQPRPAARPVSRRQRPAGARQAAGRRGARRLSGCAGARPPSRSWRCFSTGRPRRSTSMSIRPRPRSAFATPPWCAG